MWVLMAECERVTIKGHNSKNGIKGKIDAVDNAASKHERFVKVL